MTTASKKSPTAVLLLCIFLGGLGIHRFYVGKIGTGILMLLTGGGLGIWYMIDIALIICNKFTDKNGKIIELSKKPPSFKKVMTIFGILLVLFYGFFISIIVSVVAMTNVLTEVAQEQLSALRSNDIKKAYSYTSNDFKKATSLEDFRRFVSNLKLETNESASFLERKIENNAGYIKGTVNLKDGATFSIEYLLNKEDNQWKIRSINAHPSDKQSNDNTQNSSSNINEKRSTAVNEFKDKNNKFSIKYPNNWVYNKSDAKSVVFGNTKDVSMVNIQTVPSKKKAESIVIFKKSKPT